ncbi:ABC transporter substrate-binding protein [Sulfitobacter pseudonitzschiae]|uniref:ABC transporter substrate-binding protein n=1 Tax=Pseudosulfitobacter pseudonitzschiae TaxID=1402135 RepID=A0A9Q2NL75_9RHOB|nr:ABC transporter substrate-binding protein [Pseudosulfitobacter pseudonitzschiae]MBM2293057.1 ABC transporter substrate-binding protein [Pseudosulfitobacter pseudonitzschiae]MBM2297655.1 ABC transporter substrate-binding protein [Pseudosulfitobacter pseudonitzschiae]MBM2302569.1 ABC transporter substrate-binding protein [Pseudosulfitobacter pseudonitzschiae]MBM2312441.1 ABC transporter substrate-binding protein [Pseudosulfitobacter pseudonitzschiae]MBM2317265.1 ABC transporter substrate-bind
MYYKTLTAALLGAALSAPVAQAQTTYPLTIENCGVQVTFEAAPETAVTVGQAGTEVLYALGLGDKVAGTSVWFTEVLPEFAALNAGIERLADNDPSFESVVDKRPDIVVAQYEWHIGPQGIVATRDQFTDLGIPTYVLPADCWAKDNSTGSDGTRLAMFEMDSIYAGVTELAQIFDVSEKGEALVADLKAREAAAIETAAALDLQDASAVFWFSSTEMDIDPYVAGRKGPPSYMMEKLGLRNVVESDEEWPVVSWESIARANPSVIVVAEMDRRRFEADDVEKKLEFLRTDPVASQMDAVKNNRIVILNAHSMDPSIRNVTALETLAGALPEFDLQ